MITAIEGQARPATRKYLAKKDRAVAAASRLLNEVGVGAFSLAAVAERLDLHPASTEMQPKSRFLSAVQALFTA